MKRSPLASRSVPLRRTRIKPRSKRMANVYVDRRELVAELLTTQPVCVRCWLERSVDVHEIKSRGRGGSILNPANCRALCRTCHDWIGAHPRQALAEGYLLNSWDDEPLSMEIVAAVIDESSVWAEQ